MPPPHDTSGMGSVHGEVLALLRRWRSEIDDAELTVPIDLPALQARRRSGARRSPGRRRSPDA